MSLILSLNNTAVESIKKYCSRINPDLDLSEYVKAFLDKDSEKIATALEKDASKVDIDDFKKLVDSFFETLDFCGDNYNSEMMLEVKNDIGNFFEYIDLLNLSNDYNYELVEAFFERLSDYELEESRGIYDLLTIDSIRNSSIMKSYLDSVYFKENTISLFTKNLYKCFDSLEEDEIEKVKYVFHSSLETLEYFLEYPNELEKYFPYTIVSHFSKESMSLLFRAGDFFNYDRFFQANDYFLEVIAEMCNYMVEKTGHSVEFLDCLLPAFDLESKAMKKMMKVFEEYSDKYFVDGLENGFENDEAFKCLLSIILDGDCLSFFSTNNIDSVEKMFEARRGKFDELYNIAFGKGAYLSMRYKIFREEDFKELDGKGLLNLKQVFFKRVYGISYSQAQLIVEKYGKYVDECSSEFLDEDKDTIEILKTIKNVYNINILEPDKIKMLQVGLYRYIKENGLYTNKPENSFVMLRSLLDRMYMKSFNRELFQVTEDKKVLYVKRGVPVIDAGVDFSMIITAVNGVGDYYRNTENLQKRYNSSYASGNQGICATFINNENLGVISLGGPLIGYANLSNDSLNAMGVGDIYSCTDVFSLKNANSLTGEGKYFFTPKTYADYSRFGYNEMVIDRFLSKDDADHIKVQPSYIVCFKMDDNYQNTRMYKRSIKMAKEFGVPLVLVDVVKVKEHERDVILEMEKELFSEDKVNKELMRDIITRYMNNYTGSLTITRSRKDRGNEWNYKKDFSERGLDRFIKKVERKFENLDIDKVFEWREALFECYDLERKKNMIASGITSYGKSLDGEEFVLDDDIFFMSRIDAITDRAVDLHYIRNGLIDIDSVVYNPRLKSIPELEAVVNISNCLFKRAYVSSEDSLGTRIFLTEAASQLTEEEKLNYGVVVSYLLGDYHNNYFSNLSDGIDTLRFDLNRHYVREEVLTSSIYSDVKRTPELVGLVNKIKKMNDDDFLRMMQPIVNMVVEEKGVSVTYAEKKIVSRKNQIDTEFRYLPLAKENEIDDTKKR